LARVHRRRSLPVVLALAYGLLQAAVILHTVYAPRARVSELLLLGAMALSVAAVTLLRTRERHTPADSPAGLRFDASLAVWLAVLYSGLALQIYYGVDIGDRARPIQTIAGWSLLVPIAATLPWLVSLCVPVRHRERIARFGPMVLVILALLVACGVKVAGVAMESRPAIDVWEVLQHGARNLADGLNPFSTYVHDAAIRGAAFGNAPVYYVYTPSTLLLTTPFVLAFGDVRYLYAVSDLAAAVLLLLISRRLGAGSRVTRYASIAALLIAFHPRAFAKAWTDLLSIPLLYTFAYLALRHQAGISTAFVAGLFLSMKQYLVLLLPGVVALLRRRGAIAALVVAGIAAAVPFLIWSATDLYRSAVWFHFQTPFRADGMTVGSFVHHAFGVAWPGWIGAVAGLILSIAGAFLARKGGLLGVTTWGVATYLFLFGLSAYAFPNYYHFVMGLIAIAALLAHGEVEGGKAHSAPQS
jgi:hypothetical protein